MKNYIYVDMPDSPISVLDKGDPLLLSTNIDSPKDLFIKNPWQLPTDIWTLFDRVINYAQDIAVPIAVALFLWAAFLYLISAGNEKKVKQANSTLLWTVVGLGLIFMARGLIALIKNVFTGNI